MTRVSSLLKSYFSRSVWVAFNAFRTQEILYTGHDQSHFNNAFRIYYRLLGDFNVAFHSSFACNLSVLFTVAILSDCIFENESVHGNGPILTDKGRSHTSSLFDTRYQKLLQDILTGIILGEKNRSYPQFWTFLQRAFRMEFIAVYFITSGW